MICAGFCVCDNWVASFFRSRSSATIAHADLLRVNQINFLHVYVGCGFILVPVGDCLVPLLLHGWLVIFPTLFSLLLLSGLISHAYSVYICFQILYGRVIARSFLHNAYNNSLNYL